MLRNLLFALVLLLSGCQSLQVVERPITFDETREALTLEYMRERYGLEPETPVITPQMVVVHWTAIPTLEASFEAFDPPQLPSARADIADASALNVSAHYLVDRDGTIYQLMPDTLMARHVIGLNHVAIGIENVGGTENTTPLTRAQYKANLALIKELIAKYDISYVIGHYEYPAFAGHPLWLEKDDSYRTEKVDPGVEFMERLGRDLKNYGLNPVPQ